MNGIILDTKMNTVHVERGKTKESVVDEALELFRNGQKVICLSVKLNYKNNLSDILKTLEQEGCDILDVFEDNGFLMYFLDNPFLSYK